MPKYFAQVEESLVAAVHVVADSIVEEGGVQAGSALLNELHGGAWVFFDHKNAATKVDIGFVYNEETGSFHPVQPYHSWVLDAERNVWVAPVLYPDGDVYYLWDEDAGDWVEAPEV